MSLQSDRDRLDQVRINVEAAMAELNTVLGSAGTTGAATTPQIPIHVHYKIFRDYIEHEDALINNRNLWNINIQGFLFATYGFSVQKLAEVSLHAKFHEVMTHVGIRPLAALILVLPVFGSIVSLHCFLGVFAAQKAIDQLSQDWQTAKATHLPENRTMLPEIRGGGALKAHAWGLTAPRMFPIFCILAWAALLVSYLWFPIPERLTRFLVPE